MIQNIIFDLGGVLLNLDMEKTRSAFLNLGMRNFDALYSQSKQSGLFDLFDCGKISEQEFRFALKKQLPEQVRDEEIDFAWNAMLLDLPAERLDLLSSLGKKYRLFLLSNTNEIHVSAFSKYLNSTFGIIDFSPYFENWYYSCRIGKRKPNADAFEQVLQENNLHPSETLFIDDSIQHVEGANKIGIKGIFLAPGKTILDLQSENVF